MTLSRSSILNAAITLTLGTITCLCTRAQTQPKPSAPFNHNLIFLDPAHGGSDTGAHLPDELDEKEVTLTFATSLRPLLVAAGFTVVATRDADPPDSVILTTDQRANTANHARALACILIHATASGSGVHLSTSSLPEDSPDDTPTLIPWDSAQSSYLPQSRRLANELGLALVHVQIPTLLGRSSTSPLNNLTCPAVALEIAPLIVTGSDTTPLTDTSYQQRIAQAIVTALIAWRTHIEPSALPSRPSETPATKPAARPTPKPPTTASPSINSVKPATSPTPAPLKPATQPAAKPQTATPAKPTPQPTTTPQEPASKNPGETPAPPPPPDPKPNPQPDPGAAR